MEYRVKTRKSILIIDDEINLQHTLALILRRAGYRVITVMNDQDALDNLMVMKFDLVFLDVNWFNDKKGCLYTELKTCLPELPIIVLTDHPSQEFMNDAKQKGACEYILKPIAPGCILDVVTRILAETPDRVQ